MFHSNKNFPGLFCFSMLCSLMCYISAWLEGSKNLVICVVWIKGSTNVDSYYLSFIDKTIFLWTLINSAIYIREFFFKSFDSLIENMNIKSSTVSDNGLNKNSTFLGAGRGSGHHSPQQCTSGFSDKLFQEVHGPPKPTVRLDVCPGFGIHVQISGCEWGTQRAEFVLDMFPVGLHRAVDFVHVNAVAGHTFSGVPLAGLSSLCFLLSRFQAPLCPPEALSAHLHYPQDFQY